MFHTESRHLLNLSVQDALDCISENFNLKNFPGRACARNFLEKCAVLSLDGRYRAYIATVYRVYTISLRPLYHKILRPPLIKTRLYLSYILHLEYTIKLYIPLEIIMISLFLGKREKRCSVG